MLDDDEVFRLLRTGKTSDLYDQLDRLSMSADLNTRRSAAHWRTSALLREGRYAETLSHLDANATDYNCQCLFRLKKASVLDVLGRHHEAIAELEAAPIEKESEQYPELILEVKFYLLHLREKNGLSVSPLALVEIPEDHVSALPEGGQLYAAHLSKSDLVARVTRRCRTG